jgi:outer membrane protein assembly factor BamB
VASRGSDREQARIDLDMSGRLVCRIAVACTLIICAAARDGLAQDWPQWRGPARDGSVPASQAPREWPASYAQAWRVEVGEGYSSPVLADGRVFVHSRRDPQESVTAIDAASGKVIWRQDYAAPYQKNQYAVRMGKGPNATPLVAAGRVFTIGATGVLTAWDAASGREVWRKDFSKSVDFSKLFCGTSASPLLVGGLVVVQVGSDVGGGTIVALDPATGTAKWEWRGAGPGYASPALVTVAGTPQIVTMTNQSIVGVEAATGRQLWSVPFPDEWHENIVTPVWTGTHLVVSGIRQGTQAYTLQQAGGTWTASRVWRNVEASMYMSSPVAADGVVYGMSDKRKGHFVAIDAATGAVKWKTEGREGAQAAVLLAPSHVLYLTDGGDLSIVKRAAGEFALERKYDLGTEETWTTPLVLGRDLIVRDATSLTRLTGK